MQTVEEVVSVPKRVGKLTSGRLLARNTFWNLLGGGAPMLVAVFSIPILIRGLGKERFGILTLVWSLIGYASLFDLGLGRALTQLVARKLGAGEDREVPTLVWTSLLLMLCLGLLSATAMALLSPWLVHHELNVPVALQSEALRSFYLLGLSVPVMITAAGLRGLLEAHQRFELINTLRIPLGIFTFAGPLLVLPFSKSLVPVVATLFVGRVLNWSAHLWLCMKVVPELKRTFGWQRSAVGPLLRFGGWMTITNVVSPLMVTLDRFLIGAMVSMTAVAYYATPYEVVTKLLLIPGALMGVMFPAFSAGFAQDRERTVLLFGRSFKTLFLVLFPIALCIVTFAKDGLKLWLGSQFAEHSFRALQWLAAGVFINSLALVAYTFLQGIGKPRLTGTLHLIELPIYVTGMIWLTKHYGIEGTAVAWACRVTVDALLLFIMARRCMPVRSLQPRVGVLISAGVALLILAALPLGIFLKGLFLLLTILAFLVVGWFRVLSPEERKLAQNFINGRLLVQEADPIRA